MAKVLTLFDLEIPPPENQDFSELFEREEWEAEVQMIRALKDLGHEVRTFGVHDDLHSFFAEVRKDPPDVVFNLCEALHLDRKNEPNIAAFLELLKLNYTGAGPTALQICKDKGLAKKILTFHRIKVPQFVISRKSHPIRRLKSFPYPAFIKPLNLEASEGIAQLSFVEDEKAAIERVTFIHESLGTDAIIEEYIEGREIYVSVIGNQRLTVFPPRELFFSAVPEGEPKFASYKAKWDDQYRKRWGIHSRTAALPDEVRGRLEDTCKKIYRLFQIRGYARIDLRLKENGDIYFIEANPNPSIAREDDFARSAEKAGVGYKDLLDQIIHLALD